MDNSIFTKLIGTLAVILLVAAFIGGSDILTRFMDTDKKWKFSIIFGVLGGLFGAYGNISGFNFKGAVVSVRDIGPMLSGFVGGPIGGLIAGLLAGLHRLTFGGITANACVVATCCIGIASGLISTKCNRVIRKPYASFLLGFFSEVFHLGVVLIMVKPFETALDIVKQIAVPFVLINAVGFALMVSIITYTERQRTLVVEKGRLQSELEVANVIQRSLLPVINADYPGRKEIDISAFMEAAKEVGGDFYDVFFLDSTHIAIEIGDVSGKGVPAALFMATAKTILQNCIRDIPDLAGAVTTANNILCSRNEADMFVTLWVGALDLTNGEMTYVCAGHNPPVIVGKDGPQYLKAKSGLILAGMDGVKYRENRTTLNKGDFICLYTDGITEANNTEEKLFGEDRLLACFNETGSLTAEEILMKVKQSVRDFAGDAPQFDDMTMIGFRYCGPEEKDGSELIIEAKTENLDEVLGFVDGLLESAEWPMKSQMQIDVAVEELFVNIAHYAYAPGTGTATIRVNITENPLTAEITLIDSGTPYNPLEKEDPDITLSAEERAIGGLGIFMVKKSMDDIRYKYENGRNILTIIKSGV